MSTSKVAIPAMTMLIQVYVYYNVGILQHHSDTFDEVCDTNMYMYVLPTNAAFLVLSEPPVYNYEY